MNGLAKALIWKVQVELQFQTLILLGLDFVFVAFAEEFLLEIKVNYCSRGLLKYFVLYSY